jgi:hypothetical protein
LIEFAAYCNKPLKYFTKLGNWDWVMSLYTCKSNNSNYVQGSKIELSEFFKDFSNHPAFFSYRLLSDVKVPEGVLKALKQQIMQLEHNVNLLKDL